MDVAITKPRLLLMVLVVPDARSTQTDEIALRTFSCKAASAESIDAGICDSVSCSESTTRVAKEWTGGDTGPDLRRVRITVNRIRYERSNYKTMLTIKRSKKHVAVFLARTYH